jgi:hypothetical protein
MTVTVTLSNGFVPPTSDSLSEFDPWSADGWLVGFTPISPDPNVNAETGYFGTFNNGDKFTIGGNFIVGSFGAIFSGVINTVSVTDSAGNALFAASGLNATYTAIGTDGGLTNDPVISFPNGFSDNTFLNLNIPLIMSQAGGSLFTTGADTVDFNNLTSKQQAAIASGADIYHGRGGNDVVTLPNAANFNESVGNGRTLGWTNTAASTFYTGSLAGDTYHVIGGDGSYFIVEGAGTEFVTINGDGSSNITAGSGADTITINGNGNNTVTAGSGLDAITIDGNGDNTIIDGKEADTININGSGTDTIVDHGEPLNGTVVDNGTVIFNLTGTDTSSDTLSGNGEVILKGTGTLVLSGTDTSTGDITIDGPLELKNATAAGSATITFAPGVLDKLIIDGTTMPTNKIKGFMPGDIIDLKNVPFDSGTGATLLESNNTLQIVERGKPYNLNLDPSQNFDGGFQLARDASGTGTKVTYTKDRVTGYSTSATVQTSPTSAVSPYHGVCEISDSLGGGTGFIIGAHYILTAAHVVSVRKNSATLLYANNINIYPGTSFANTGNKITGTPLSNPGWTALTVGETASQAANDYAVIYTATDLKKYGIFGLQPNFPSGTVNLTGYPGTTTQFNDIGSVLADPYLALLNYGATDSKGNPIKIANPITASEGNSGGPLWVYNGATVNAVGIAVTAARGVRFTQAVLSGITDLEGDLANPGSDKPTLSVKSPALTVRPGASVPLGVVVTASASHAVATDILQVTISGVPRYETITAGSRESVTHIGTSYTVTAETPGASISDLTLNSFGTLANTLSVTAMNEGEPATSSQSITVNDPPAGSSGSIPTMSDSLHTHSLALLAQYMASSFVTPRDGQDSALITDPMQNEQNSHSFLAANAHHG